MTSTTAFDWFKTYWAATTLRTGRPPTKAECREFFVTRFGPTAAAEQFVRHKAHMADQWGQYQEYLKGFSAK